MKRWRILGIVLAALICAWLAGSAAESPAAPDLYDVYEATETGTRWIANAAPVMEGKALAVGLRTAAENPRLILSDGRRQWEATAAVPTAGGLVTVILYTRDETAETPIYTMTEPDGTLDLTGCRVRFGDALGSRINRAVLSASMITWMEHECMLMTLSGEAEIGAVIRTGDGGMAGMIAAEYAEGQHRYVALTSGELFRCMMEASAILSGMQQYSPPEGFSVTAEGNEVTFDWSGMALPAPGEGEKLFLVIAESQGTYYSYYPAEDMLQVTIVLTPGRTYLAGMTVCKGAPDGLPEQAAVFSLPAAERVTEYGFRSLVCAIAEMPEGGLPDGAMPTPVTEVTEELLRSGRACFYSLTRYEIAEAGDVRTLLITLTDPNGNNYRYVSGWTYDPAYMARDEWYVTMDSTGLLELLNRAEYPRGTYRIDMYIGGKLADSFSFEIQ